MRLKNSSKSIVSSENDNIQLVTQNLDDRTPQTLFWKKKTAVVTRLTPSAATIPTQLKDKFPVMYNWFSRKCSDTSADNQGIIISGDYNIIHYGPVVTPVTLQIPFLTDNIKDNIQSLLIWRSRLTNLIGRQQELQQLRDWADSESSISIRVIHGQSGVGKTRLAFELADLLRNEGWEAGQLLMSDVSTGYRFGKHGVLLVIDNPEQQSEAVKHLLQAISNAQLPPVPLRILLLSRSMHHVSVLVEHVQAWLEKPLALEQLDASVHGWQLFQAAWSRIIQLKNQPESSPPINQSDFKQWQLSHVLHGTPLFIIAYAINLVDDTDKIDLSGVQVLNGLLEREIKSLSAEAENLGIDCSAVVILKALAAISGGLNQTQLAQMRNQQGLDWLPNAQALSGLTDWQHATTDANGNQFSGQLSALQPDMLAATLLANQLHNNDHSGLLQFAALDVAPQIKNASSRLARLIHDATQVLELPWPMQSLIELVPGNLELCQRMDAGLNRNYLDGPLLPLALVVTKTLVEQYDDLVVQARHLNNLSADLVARGDREAGLLAIQRAVEIREYLANDNPGVFEPVLANSLANLADFQAEEGNAEQAVEIVQRAIRLMTPYALKGTKYAEWQAGMERNLTKYRTQV